MTLKLPATLRRDLYSIFKEQDARFEPDEETREFIAKVYDDFRQDSELRSKTFKIFNDRSIEQIWADSLDDYVEYLEAPAVDDWVHPYVSSISRDKIGTEIALILQSASRPAVVAQNKEQDIDRVVSRALRMVSEYAAKMDGYPSSNGKRKRLMYCLNLVTYGTVHVAEDMIDGQAVRTLIPNEEIYIPNFWQQDIQKQAHLLRVSNDVTYAEAFNQFGHLENFKYVKPGSYENWWWSVINDFKDYQNSVSIQENRIQVIRSWYPVPKSHLKRGQKQQRYFNILINGVPMYPYDNLSPYKHGFTPIAKEVFEEFESGLYFGDSLSNKIRHDKRWRDDWKTLLRAKAKLAVVPPFFAWNGLTINEDVVVPNKITSMPSGKPGDLTVVHDEFVKGVTNADVTMLRLSEEEIERGTQPNIASGTTPTGSPTARQIAVQSSYVQINEGPTVDRFFTLEASLEYFRLHNIVQFWPRKKLEQVAKISIPDLRLRGGKRGTFEVLFAPIDEMTEDEFLMASDRIREQEDTFAEQGEAKEITVIDPSYLRELTLYAVVEEKPVTDVEFVKELDAYDRLSRNQSVNQDEVTRDLIRAMGKDEERLLKREEQPQELSQPAPTGRLPSATATGQGLGLETETAQAAFRPETTALPAI